MFVESKSKILSTFSLPASNRLLCLFSSRSLLSSESQVVPSCINKTISYLLPHVVLIPSFFITSNQHSAQ